MKIQRTVALVAALLFCLIKGIAQPTTTPVNESTDNRPKIFNDIPDKQTLHLKELENLLELPVGTKVNVAVAKNFILSGTIVSRSNPSSKTTTSVVVKSLLRQGTLLTFTRIAEPNGTFSYLGRLLNRSAGDALEIVREANGYVLRKRNIRDIINE